MYKIYRRITFAAVVLVIIAVSAFQLLAWENASEEDIVYSQTQKVESRDFFELFNLDEAAEGKYYTMIDDNDNRILRTARHIHVGDRFICGKNKMYEVHTVTDYTARAREIERTQAESGTLREVFSGIGQRFFTFNVPALFQREQNDQENRVIGIYHSHGAESYVPSDGTESIPEGGGILDVGRSLASALEEKGIQVIHSEEPHVPHDSGAYMRSRRTAEELLQEGPDALFDVHRDAVPPEEYLEEIEGKERVQVLMVVGRQNQNSASNQQFAEGLKASADELYPNLTKGILMAQGSYNQDLTPRAMLLEVGAHENEKEGAEESIALFAGVIDNYLYGTEQGREQIGLSPDTRGGPGGTAVTRVIGLILLVVAAAAAYLFISTENLEELKAKLKDFTTKEFRDIAGRFNKEKDKIMDRGDNTEFAEEISPDENNVEENKADSDNSSENNSPQEEKDSNE